MYDESSQRILINKKISQLVLLINHLSTTNAEREYGISILNHKFNELYNQCLNDYQQSIRSIHDQSKLIYEKAESVIKNKYSNYIHELNFDFNDSIEKLKENIDDFKSFVEFQALKYLETVQTINNNINIFSHKFASLAEQQIKNISNQQKVLKEEYQKEIAQLNVQFDPKIQFFEENSQKNFSNAFQALKSHSDQHVDSKYVNLYLDRNLKAQINKYKLSIVEIKAKFQLFLNFTQNIFRQQKENSKILIDSFQNDMNDLSAKKQKLEKQFFSEENEFQKSLKNLLEAKKLKKEEERRNTQVVEESEHFFKQFETQSMINSKTEDKIDDFFEMKCEIKKSYENKLFENEKEIQKQDELFLKINEELIEHAALKRSKESAYSSLLVSHENEIEHLKTEFYITERDLMKKYQKEIDLIKESNPENQDILEKQNEIRELSIEKQNILNSLFQNEIRILNESFEKEKNELIEKLDQDMIDAQKQEKLLIGAVSDAHRNEVFVKNNEIARNYDMKLEKIRNKFKQKNYEEEINIFYENKQKEFEEKLQECSNNSSPLPVSNNDDEICKLNSEIEKLNELKMVKMEKIRNERKLINDSYVKQKEKEASQHDKVIESNKQLILQKSNEVEEKLNEIQNEYKSRLEKLDVSAGQLRILLEHEKRKSSSSADEVNEAFNQNEKELKKIFIETKNEAEKMIQKVNQMSESKKEMINKQIIEMPEKVEHFKRSIQSKSDKKSSLIEQFKIEAKNKIQKIQENLKKQEILLTESHSDILDKLQKNHAEKLSVLIDQINNQKIINQNENQKQNENTFNESKQLELFENKMINDVNELKTKHETILNELDGKIDEIKKNNSYLEASFAQNTMREEENLLIKKLEDELSFVEQHMKDVTLDLATCKKRIISQEGTYNSQFGNAPAVAVLRPNTGFMHVNARGSLRPNTTITINRSKSLIKNRTSVIHF